MLVQNKKALILGLANDRSLAWSIAESLHAQGASIALTYGIASSEKRAVPLAEKLSASFCQLLDVRDENHWKNLTSSLQAWGKIDIVVHSMAFAPPSELASGLMGTSLKGLQETLEVSAFSFVRLAQLVQPYLNPGASLLALTNIGSERVIPGYGMMGMAKAALESSVRYLAHELGPQGVRVNAISAGPVRTMSAMGVEGFDAHYLMAKEKAPLRQNTNGNDVGLTAVYLASELSKHVTGTVQFVDGGLHVVGA